MNLFQRNKIEYYLILLIPFSAVISIFFLEVSLIIITGTFLFKSLRDKEYKYFNNKFFLLFLIFYFYILVRYFFIEKDYFFWSSSIIFYFRFGLYAIALWYFLKNIFNLDKHFTYSVFICFTILAIDSVFQFTFEKNLIGFTVREEGRLSSFFGDELVLGSYLVRFLPFIYILLLTNLNKNKNYILSLLLIILCDVIIFLSGERAAAGLMIIQTLYFLIMLKRIRFMRIWSIVVSSIIIVLILINSTDVKNRMINTTSKELKENNRLNNSIFPHEDLKFGYYFVSPTHTNYLYTSINMFKNNFLFGKGPKSYRYFCSDERYNINHFSCATHPHNFYVQMLAELGIVGLGFLSFVFFFVIWKSLNILFTKSNKDQSYLICLLSFFFINLWPLTSSGNFFNNWLSILMFVPISFLLYKVQK
tara:strand:- start:244 stop:1500 length:1257 start_codon:yes stop_codon:yes gene_type:complete